MLPHFPHRNDIIQLYLCTRTIQRSTTKKKYQHFRIGKQNNKLAQNIVPINDPNSIKTKQEEIKSRQRLQNIHTQSHNTCYLERANIRRKSQKRASWLLEALRFTVFCTFDATCENHLRWIILFLLSLFWVFTWTTPKINIQPTRKNITVYGSVHRIHC